VTGALANDLRATGTWHEAYHSETGAGLAAAGFLSWDTLGATLVRDVASGIDIFRLVGARRLQAAPNAGAGSAGTLVNFLVLIPAGVPPAAAAAVARLVTTGGADPASFSKQVAAAASASAAAASNGALAASFAGMTATVNAPPATPTPAPAVDAGVIVGAAFGALALVLVVAFAACVCLCKAGAGGKAKVAPASALPPKQLAQQAHPQPQVVLVPQRAPAAHPQLKPAQQPRRLQYI
jgi:hypothetical protein